LADDLVAGLAADFTGVLGLAGTAARAADAVVLAAVDRAGVVRAWLAVFLTGAAAFALTVAF
jgi:hypothetical protein